ncbi:MAG: T9SS type A sorting domain-containing protein [Saprospiraceae bacterium]
MEVTATVATGTTAILTAGRKIRFLPGFVADAGSDLHAYIDSCATPEVSTSTTLSKSEDVTATDQVIPATVLSGADQSADTGLEVFPNPFTTEVTIRFYLQEAGQTTLNIFDLQGRLVRQLHQETLDAGSYQWQWDGTGRGGNRLPSGMYLVQLRSAEVVVNKRVLFQYD